MCGVGIDIREPLNFCLIARRREDSLPVEPPRDLSHAVSRQIFRKNSSYDLGCWPVDQQPVFVCWILIISIGSKSADKLACFPFCVHNGTHLFGNILCVQVIHDRLKRPHVILGAALVKGIDPVSQRDIAHPPARKIAFEIIAGINIVPPQTGKILGQHQIDPPRLDVTKHALETGAVKMEAGIAVVNIVIHDFPVLLHGITLQKCLLIGNTFRPALCFILFGKAQIQSGAPVFFRIRLHALHLLFRHRMNRPLASKELLLP